MIFWAATLSFQKSGAWAFASSSAIAFSFVSTSKIPPERRELAFELFQLLFYVFKHSSFLSQQFREFIRGVPLLYPVI
jgi:hypothetical protein